MTAKGLAWRVAAWVLGGGVLLSVLVAGGGWLWLRSGLPVTEGEVTVAGPGDPVHIIRDPRGVPRIIARTMDDAYFALGYVHAQDRLWQMDMMRRLGAGRLAEILPGAAGAWVLGNDRLMRSLGLYRLALSSYQALAPEVRRAFDSYAAGVNAYLEGRRGPLPVEFQLLGYRPEPWQPADSLVWAKLEALQLSGHFREQLLRARLLNRLTPEQVRDLYPLESGPVTLAAGLPASDTRLAGLLQAVAAALPPPSGFDEASNEWVVAGDRTSSGKPILANDPHLGLQSPVLWYLARIETPELTLSGATVPGVPFHLLGHNGTIAWGITSTGSDTQDVFVERLDPHDPSLYLTPTGPVPFETRQETLPVRGGPPQTLTVRLTRHGPVLPEDGPLADVKPAPGQVLALAFTGLSGQDTTAEAFYRLNRARDWNGFVAALRLYQTPQENFVYADTGGAIGFYAPGLVPIRARGDGFLPVPGWSGVFDWTGTVPFEALPHALDPPSGHFANANNAVTGADYPYRLAGLWPDPSRAERIEQLLADGGPQSVAASLAMQQDVVSLAARRLLPLMLPRPGPDTLALSRPAQQAAELLRRWTGRVARQDPEPLIFSWWQREFERVLFSERLGPLFSEYWSLHPSAVAHILSEAPAWCARPAEPGARTCAELLRTSLETTVRQLSERYGDQPDRWQWGFEHQAPFEHPLLSRIPLLGSLFALHIATDGDAFTLDCGASRIADDQAPFADIHGPGLRAVYDLADLDQSLFMIATGQSGNPLSPHYHDLIDSWRDGAMLTLSPSAWRMRTVSLTLMPPGH